MSLTLSVLVSSPGGNVQLENPSSGTTIMSISPGERGVVLNEATSPVMDGSVIHGFLAERGTATLQIRCWGTPATVLGKLHTLEQLFNQLSYTVTVSINGVSQVWACGPGTTGRGQKGEYVADELAAGWQDLIVSIPKQPDTLI